MRCRAPKPSPTSWVLSPNSATNTSPREASSDSTMHLLGWADRERGLRDLDPGQRSVRWSKVSLTPKGPGTGAHRPACRSPGEELLPFATQQAIGGPGQRQRTAPGPYSAGMDD